MAFNLGNFDYNTLLYRGTVSKIFVIEEHNSTITSTLKEFSLYDEAHRL